MSNINQYESLWSILRKYNFTVNELEHVDYICILCKKLLIEAKQAPCSCRFCGNCIEDYLSQGNSLCPGNTSECNDEKLHINENISNDHVTNRKISKLKLKCPSDNCIYEDILSNMDQHLVLCGKPSIACPFSQFGCNQVRNDKDEIMQHLQLENYEHSHLMIEMIVNLKNEVNILRKDNELLKSKSEEQQKLIENLELEIKEIKEEDITYNFSDYENDDHLYDYVDENYEHDFFDISSSYHDYDESSDDSNEQGETGAKEVIYKAFPWTISEFCNKRKSFYESPAFYTHENGYRIQMRLLPVYERARCSGVMIYPNCIQGNYDGYLDWPLEAEISISVVDQRTGFYLNTITRCVSYVNSNKSRVAPYEFTFQDNLPFYENALKIKCTVRIK